MKTRWDSLSARTAAHGSQIVLISGTSVDAHYNRGVETLATRIADAFEGRADVVAVYLFGSHARGDARPNSDVDVAVLFASRPPSTLDAPRFVLEGELERTLGKPVDLIVLNDAPVDLRIRVLRDGMLLVDRVPERRIAFEVRTRNEAFDLEPVLTRYRAARTGS